MLGCPHFFYPNLSGKVRSVVRPKLNSLAHAQSIQKHYRVNKLKRTRYT